MHVWMFEKERVNASLPLRAKPQFNSVSIDTVGRVTEPRKDKTQAKHLTFVYRGHRCKDFCYSWQRIKRDFFSELNENLPS